jgi:hypothetical protein
VTTSSGHTGTPGDRFPMRRRGYDPAAVDAHIAHLESTVRSLEADRSSHTEAAALLLLQQAQQTADHTLIAANLWAQHEREEASREAAAVLAAAREQAAAAVRAAEDEARRTRARSAQELAEHDERLDALRAEEARRRARLAQFAEEHAETLRQQSAALLAVADDLDPSDGPQRPTDRPMTPEEAANRR